jgi:predicted amidohydrolase
MMIRRIGARLGVLLYAVGACSGSAANTTPADSSFALVNATVVDVANGALQDSMTVVIRGNRIRALGPSTRIRVPSGARQLNLQGRFLIPGLWDMHVHALFDPIALRTMFPVLLANGVTGIRDMGGGIAVMSQARRELMVGTLTGPRIIASGVVLDGPQPVDPDISIAIRDSADVVRAVDSLARAGANFIKVYTLLSPAAFAAAGARARQLGLPIAGHIPHGVSEISAATVMRSVEHMRVETGGFCTPATRHECDPIFAAFRSNHTWQTPTLTAREVRTRFSDSALATDPRLVYSPRLLRRMWETNRLNNVRRGEAYLAGIRRRFANEKWLASELIAAGLPILAGSDAGSDYSIAGFGLHEELETLAEAGLGNAGALRAATIGAAAYLGATDSLGTVAPGRVADIVVLSSNPLVSIESTRHIEMLIYNGRVFDRAALDRMLRQAAVAAR